MLEKSMRHSRIKRAQDFLDVLLFLPEQRAAHGLLARLCGGRAHHGLLRRIVRRQVYPRLLRAAEVIPSHSRPFPPNPALGHFGHFGDFIPLSPAITGNVRLSARML
jgi:hypothetical protein